MVWGWEEEGGMTSHTLASYSVELIAFRIGGGDGPSDERQNIASIVYI